MWQSTSMTMNTISFGFQNSMKHKNIEVIKIKFCALPVWIQIGKVEKKNLQKNETQDEEQRFEFRLVLERIQSEY